jgi:hypothetical protein
MGGSVSKTYGVSTLVRLLLTNIFNPTHAHPDVEQTVPDTAVWTQIKPDTLHRRLSHSSAQVGSYLFISGGHDGSEYSPELLLFNLGKLPSLIPDLSNTSQY